MGCTQSKIENEEAVSRCKERKQFMREAVSARNAFASAQSSYTVALKNSGAALHDYGQGEVQDHRPSQQPTQPSIELPPPPPPLPNFPPPLQRAATMPEFVIPEPNHNPTEPINEDDEEDNDTDTDNNLIHRRNAGGSVGGGGGSSRIAEDPPAPQPPPSPPRTPPISTTDPPQPPDSMEKAWDFFFPSAENMPGPSLSDTHEITSHNDEGTTSGGRYKRVEEPVDDGDIGSKSRNEVETPPVGPDMVIEPAMKPVKKSKLVVHSHTSSADAKRVGKAAPNVTLLQILSELDDHFLKAYESAQDVSKMLEANRLHYHSNFADNRGHIDHSARVMRVITWNRSFRGMANVDDGKDDLDKEEHETHATTLDKMLAWEKKLYDEVKAGELMKIEYQRKVGSLNKQKKRGTNSDALEKTKAAVSHLHTRYIVDMQSMDSTVSEINRLRDQQLFPKLVALVDGMANMWENMSLHHRSQLKIVNDIKFLDISQAPKETSEHHHERTVQLWNVVNEWHSQFQKLVTYQKEYIRALNSWLKLNLIPIESSLKEKVSSPPRVEHPPIQALLHTWHDLIEKLPDEGAKSAISSFAAVIKTIMLHQDEEMKLKEKYEETNKELARKNRAFEDWHRKYMERRTPPDDMSLETGEDANHKDPVMERQFVVETLKRRLEEEIEAHRKVCLQVREKSLGSLKTSLPELFRCMSEFALRCSHMYKDLSSISQSHN